jgi:hypothetical protein
MENYKRKINFIFLGLVYLYQKHYIQILLKFLKYKQCKLKKDNNVLYHFKMVNLLNIKKEIKSTVMNNEYS